MLEKNINLEDYLENLSRSKDKDSYSMSIRELGSMYKEGLINLSPVYQRKFRWDNLKASKLIESIFLSIPLPPIFVSVRNGKWDVVDGVQRISSILWFCGILDETTDKREELELIDLEKLELLNGKTYSFLKDKYSKDIFKYFDMKRLDVTLLTSNDVESEYDLFSRLNTGGLNLSSQEIRNFLIVKLDPILYDELLKISKNEDITKLLGISKKQQDEDYGMELLVYFIIISKTNNKFKNLKNHDTIKGIDLYKEYASKHPSSRSRFIDKCIADVLYDGINVDEEILNLKKTFKKIEIELGNSPFSKGRKFSPFIYICLISYLCNNSDKTKKLTDILELIQKNELYKKSADRGANVVKQFITGIEIGRDILKDE
ncbi:DUF262 domain-containing protein [Fusobacterium ulcerans]|uniref:Protein of uncharacterized function DUF262 n=1 Tax=Fusobacterium ulcerans TaxID=861 RepID=A0AAX2JEA8_9FUSO|nr:DUF262 domain-containing protein [Fusobacterium ulcerans]AVQ26592.1 DUF262 domain-containing protein [Fusobacterium ulcerans]EFS25290.1 hypothetical protein FUAG_00805 [Fusobacterium ulcerans ATCC 49185]SQJ05658.1 Protein of uncharacterised function DUF262 [Fusobacterium ulcerans]